MVRGLALASVQVRLALQALRPLAEHTESGIPQTLIEWQRWPASARVSMGLLALFPG